MVRKRRVFCKKHHRISWPGSVYLPRMQLRRQVTGSLVSFCPGYQKLETPLIASSSLDSTQNDLSSCSQRPLTEQHETTEGSGIIPPSPPKDGGRIEDEKYSFILATLKTMNSKLQKSDTLENLTTTLQEEISKGNSRIEEVSVGVNMVKIDLTKYDQKWEQISSSINSRLASLEKCTHSWDNKLEQSRQDTANSLKILQWGIDSNSKKTLEFENFLKKSEEKWESLHRLENKIKLATEKKFQELKKLITLEVKEEIVQEVKAGRLQFISPEEVISIKTELKQ